MGTEATQNSLGRTAWVDALKFLGIFAIYLGHYAEQAGKFYLFVFSYHVPLFFFAAGIFASSPNEKTIVAFLSKKLRTIILPYYIFAAIFEVAHAIYYNLDARDILFDMQTYVSAIRNTLDAWSLWFFTCLFVVSILYHLGYLMCRNKTILFILSLISFLFANADNPSLFWNIDSAAVYLVYYALGSLVFPFLNAWIAKPRHTLVDKFSLFAGNGGLFALQHWFISRA